MLVRLKQHLHLRIKNKHKHNNYAISWFQSNLPQFCALVALSRHIANDLHSTDENSTLIAHPSDEHSTFATCTKNDLFSDLEGCYLYYDQNRHNWIRSGKAVGSRYSKPKRSFKTRHEEHKKEAGATNNGNKYEKSKFYSCYPIQSTADSNDCRRRGYFDNLVQYCGIGFNRDDDTSNITATSEDEGIFTWSNDVIEQVTSLHLSTNTELKDKQLVMVVFLELGYDLMISVQDNVSERPGFEPCLGIFGTKS